VVYLKLRTNITNEMFTSKLQIKLIYLLGVKCLLFIFACFEISVRVDYNHTS